MEALVSRLPTIQVCIVIGKCPEVQHLRQCCPRIFQDAAARSGQDNPRVQIVFSVLPFEGIVKSNKPAMPQSSMIIVERKSPVDTMTMNKG